MVGDIELGDEFEVERREVVKSLFRRRKCAVEIRAGRGGGGDFTVVRKVFSQV